MALVDSMELVKKIEPDMGSELGKLVESKLCVLEKIAGFNTLCRISKVLMGNMFETSEIKQEFTPRELVYFKYAPIVFVDVVEKSFSMYRYILADIGSHLLLTNSICSQCSTAMLNKVWSICLLFS